MMDLIHQTAVLLPRHVAHSGGNFSHNKFMMSDNKQRPSVPAYEGAKNLPSLHQPTRPSDPWAGILPAPGPPEWAAGRDGPEKG